MKKNQNCPKTMILIVDNNPQNLMNLCKILEKTNYCVAMSQTEEQINEYILSETPDLILIDITMPGLEGLEICKKIKSDSQHRNIPVILVTPRNDANDIFRALKAGANDYILRPYLPEELQIRLTNMLELKRARQEIKILQELIPVCACCKRTRDDDPYWEKVNQYIEIHHHPSSPQEICPECLKELTPEIQEPSLAKEEDKKIE